MHGVESGTIEVAGQGHAGGHGAEGEEVGVIGDFLCVYGGGGKGPGGGGEEKRGKADVGRAWCHAAQCDGKSSRGSEGRCTRGGTHKAGRPGGEELFLKVGEDGVTYDGEGDQEDAPGAAGEKGGIRRERGGITRGGRDSVGVCVSVRMYSSGCVCP